MFLDRDGVLIHDSRNYIRSVADVRLIAGAAEAVRLLNNHDLPAIVVTNQSAVARGYVTEEELHAINQRMFDLIAAESGARIDRLYYCPYHPDGTVPKYARSSGMRKPEPGMLLAAAAELDLDLARSFMVGDQESDMIAARRAGCGAVAVTSDLQSQPPETWTTGTPDWIAPGVGHAVRQILERMQLGVADRSALPEMRRS